MSRFSHPWSSFPQIQRLHVISWRLDTHAFLWFTWGDAQPLHRRDPFDRLLIAPSRLDGLTLVSLDPVFDAYGITRLW
jgi:PIN domain nuclease of toxin-antitoxin system